VDSQDTEATRNDLWRNDERLSPKSQNDYFTHIKRLWKWAAEHDYIDKSPAVVLKDVADLRAWDQRPAFTDDQLRAFLAIADSEDDPAFIWGREDGARGVTGMAAEQSPVSGC
jgi:integrase